MATAFIYNPFAVDGPGKPYCTRTTAELWRDYLAQKERPSTSEQPIKSISNHVR